MLPHFAGFQPSLPRWTKGLPLPGAICIMPKSICPSAHKVYFYSSLPQPKHLHRPPEFFHRIKPFCRINFLRVFLWTPYSFVIRFTEIPCISIIVAPVLRVAFCFAKIRLSSIPLSLQPPHSLCKLRSTAARSLGKNRQAPFLATTKWISTICPLYREKNPKYAIL